MKWLTRERPKVDRIACPWLIKRFVDPEAVFLYAPGEQVLAVAEREGATPYDIAGAELRHPGRRATSIAGNRAQLTPSNPRRRTT